MGWGAARKLRQSVANLGRILAVEVSCAARGLDLRAPLQPGMATAAALVALRADVPGPGQEVPGAGARRGQRLVRSAALLAATEAAIGPLSRLAVARRPAARPRRIRRHRRRVRARAQHAEEHGMDSVWLFDHVLTPVTLRSPYPTTRATLAGRGTVARPARGDRRARRRHLAHPDRDAGAGCALRHPIVLGTLRDHRAVRARPVIWASAGLDARGVRRARRTVRRPRRAHGRVRRRAPHIWSGTPAGSRAASTAGRRPLHPRRPAHPDSPRRPRGSRPCAGAAARRRLATI